MKLLNLKGFLALAALAAGMNSQVANAAAGNGDVLLGFRATGGTGANTNLVVNLGQASQFTGASSATTVTNIGADLEAVYGTGWASRTDVLWGVAGASGSFSAVGSDPAKTTYASRVRPSLGTTATPWDRKSDSSSGFTTTQINTARSAFNLGTPGTNPLAVTEAAADNNSWSAQQPGGIISGGISFQTWSASIEANATQQQDFFRMAPGSGLGTHVGTFSLGSDGSVLFVPASLVGDLAVGGVISVSTPVVFAPSGSTSATVTLTRTGGLGAASVEVDTATVTGGAATPADFAALTNLVVNFAVGQTSVDVDLSLTGAVIPSTKAFNVVISTPSGATLGSTTTASVRIRGSAADTTPPTLALTAPISGAVLSSTKAAAFTGTVTDASGLDTLTIAFNGGAAEAVTVAAGKFTKSYANETSATAAGIIPGNNSAVLTATDFDGNVSTVTRTFFYEKLVPVTVTSTNGLLTFTPKLGGTLALPTAAIGRTYSVSAKANTGFFFSAYSGTADISAPTASVTPVTFASGETLVATFTASPFTSGATGVAGTYNGIVKGSTVSTDTQANAGILNVIVTVNTGAFTGKLNLDGVITPIAGVFDNVDGSFSTPDVNNGTAYDLTLDFATKVVSGSITKFKRGVEVAQVNVNAPHAYVTTAFTPATYHVAFGAPASPAPDLLPGEYPEGNGYGVLTVDAKAGAKLVGKLADGTAYSSSSVACPPVSPATEDTVPVFASFAGIGSLVGEALVEAGVVDSSSAFRWFKKENAGQYYPYGFANGATTGLSIDIVAGGTRTAATIPTIVLNTSTVSFTGGSLDLAGDALFDVHNMVITSATNPKLTFNATTKLLTGTYTAGAEINTIAGIVVGNTAYGYILTPLPKHTDGTGEGGLVTLVP